MNKIQKFWYRIKTVYSAWELSKDPEATENVYQIGFHQDALAKDSIEKGRVRDPFVDYPELESQWLDGYAPTYWDLETLIKKPLNSLGYHYAFHMKEKKLDPNRYDNIAPKDKYHWLRLRIQKTHDIWHVVTGFDTDRAGEVGSQGIYFAQYVNGQSALILGGGIMKTILRENYDITEKFIDGFIKGYILGKKAKPLLPVKWEKYWDEDIEEVREMMNIDLVQYEKVQELHGV
jgi:ubiquinone biosynthesis protein COQ4